MIFKLENILVRALDQYLISQPYKEVASLIASLKLELKPKLGPKNDKGQVTIEYFCIDSKTMNLLLTYLNSKPYGNVRVALEELKKCKIIADDQLETNDDSEDIEENKNNE